MKSYFEKHRSALGTIGGITAFVIAMTYLKFTPEEASTVEGLQKFILIYGHSLCWILLSTASILWATVKKNRWPRSIAYAALITYIIFIGTLLIAKFM